MSGERVEDSDPFPESAPRPDSGGAELLSPATTGEGPADLTRTVGEMKRLLKQLEQIEKTEAAGAGNGAAGALQVTARILQYVHDSHARIVKTLENQDRSELFLQSTNALNQTFRKLNQSQDSLVEKLLAERRRNPWYLAGGAALAAAVMVVSVFLLIDYRNGGLSDEVDRMAAERAGMTGAYSEAQVSFERMGTQLAQTVDNVLAANRVLDNESRAKTAELERIRTELEATTTGRAAVEKQHADAAARLEAAERSRRDLELEVDVLRTKLVDQDALRDRLDRLDHLLASPAAGSSPVLGAPEAVGAAGVEAAADAARDASGTGPAADDSAPDPTSGAESTALDPAAEATSPPAADTGTRVAGADRAEEDGETPNRSDGVDDSSLFDATTRAVNDFLGAAGVIDHRLLRHAAAVDGELREVVLELRSAEGLPIGCRSAAGMKIVVDPARLVARLVLRDGETVDHGTRVPYPDGALEIAIAAVAPQSFTVRELLPFLVLESSDSASPGQRQPSDGEPASLAPRLDLPALYAVLNGALRSEGRAHLQFARIGGKDGERLQDVELNHYSGAGALLKTVVARSCAIEVDSTTGRATLVFRDGHHVTNGRKVSFFRGRGEAGETSEWRLEFDDADVEGWLALKERLAADRFDS